MTTALAATHRIDLQYSVQGYPHRLRVFCTAALVSGVYMLNDRSGSPTIDRQDAVDDLVAGLAGILHTDTGTSIGPATLEQRIGTVWVPLEVITPAAPSFGSVAVFLTSQVTVTLRDAANHKVRVIVLESQAVPGQHATTLAGIPTTGLVNFAGSFTEAYSADLNAPWYWARGRSGLILGSAPFVAYTSDLNDKIRRGRHVA